MALISLTEGEHGYAMLHAESRQEESVQKGSRDAHGYRGDALKAHRIGAAGEMAVAKALGVSMRLQQGTYKAADLGQSVQVRATFKPTGDLILRPGDNPAHVYVLANHVPTQGLAEFQAFEIRGWCYGHEAPLLGTFEERQGRPGAWFIKAEKLRALEDLPKAALAVA